jgi:hypothetical protein
VSAPAPSGGPSPLRIGGLALLGAGVVAAVIGLATLATSGGGDDTKTAAPAPASSVTEAPAPAPTTEAPPPAAAEPPANGSVPVPSFGPTATNGIAAPPAAPAPAPGADTSAAGSGGGSGGSAAVVRAPVRVYNNSTITGLASRAADDFRNAGWPVEKVANYPSGTIPTSTVYYRPGTNEQAAAQAIAGEFGLRVEPRFEGLNEASPGLIVIVTNDYQRRG